MVEDNLETVDEGDLELELEVCEVPPPKKKAPMVVDMTLSSSDSKEDDTLLNIGSQSSRPSTADSVDGPSISGKW